MTTDRAVLTRLLFTGRDHALALHKRVRRARRAGQCTVTVSADELDALARDLAQMHRLLKDAYHPPTCARSSS